ncbi:MAG: tetratricopeptide repeat protein, partial [Chloroflexota bacterium]|nr:tetratricopeptide repeat protein [Chloroflexota bacterium]
WQAWALMEKELGNHDEARRLFEQGIKADPTDAPTWQAWALMERELGKYDKAWRLFERASRAAPGNSYIWQNWAMMELRRDPKRASDLLNRALQNVQDPGSRAVLLGTRGRALTHLKRFDEAKEAFKESLRLDERNHYTHYFYARELLEPLGCTEEACAHYRRVLELDPSYNPGAAKGLRRLGCK